MPRQIADGTQFAMAPPGFKSRPREEGDAAVKDRQEVKKPNLYRVLLHNDDYTTMEFVVFVLMQFFSKSRTEATQIMLHVHTKGIGLCGVYTHDVAETKVKQVTDEARQNEMPLLCTMERDEAV